MATVTTEDLRNMTPLRVANHTVGKPDETLAMMEEDGYVYFRDVLDQGAVGRLRQRYMDVLVDWGVVDPGAREPIWNGADLSTFPVKIEPLHDARSEEHTSELQSLMRISYAVFCLKKKQRNKIRQQIST